MMLWHAISLVLVLAGTGFILFGAAKTSHANGGLVARAFVRFGRRVRSAAASASGGFTFTGTADAYTTPEYPEHGSAEAQIAWLRKELADQAKREDARAIKAASALSDERVAREASDLALNDRLSDLTVTVDTGLRRTALDGLLWAVVGALLICAGDVIGIIVELTAAP